MHSNPGYYSLKIILSVCVFVYIWLYVIIYEPHGNHKPIKYTHTKKRKESKHNTKLSHQITKEQKRKGRKNTYENKSRTISKMAIITYISIITLNVNRLNHPNKRERLAE